MKCTKLAAILFALFSSSLLIQTAQAAPEKDNEVTAEGYLFRTLVGDGLENNYGVRVYGWAQAGLSFSDNHYAGASGKPGQTHYPVALPGDEGFQLNAIQLVVQKDIKTNIIPRVTPLPGPKPTEASFGFTVEALYGRNGQPAAMFGFDQAWSVNGPGNKNPASAAANRQLFVAMPQVSAQAYLPIGNGIAILAGRFGSGVGIEIAPAVRPSPNFFYSKSYAFVSQPDQVAGILAATNLVQSSYGLLAAEFGVVNGWQNWEDNNSSKSVMGALRWRSPDMRFWLDYEFMTGNEQNDLNKEVQAPVSRIISPRGQNRQHHSLNFNYNVNERWNIKGEALYGRQKGDGQADTIDIVTGPGFKGAEYSGVNTQVTYRKAPNLAYALRAEHFRARDGFGLFPATAVPSDFNEVTVGLTYDLNKFVVLRPEIRHDWQSSNHGVNAFGGGTKDRQTTISLDLVIYY